MNQDQLKDFMKRHNLDNPALAKLIGLSPSAVSHWVNGVRTIAKPYGRLMRLFDRKPELMKEFN